MKYVLLIAIALIALGCDKRIHEAYAPAPPPMSR